MLFGLTFEKLVILGFIAVAIVGPARLPMYAGKLARLVQSGKKALGTARERIEEEMGVDAADIDWRKLDPRQYDPRRIIREALLEEPSSHTKAVASDSDQSDASSDPSERVGEQVPTSLDEHSKESSGADDARTDRAA